MKFKLKKNKMKLTKKQQARSEFKDIMNIKYQQMKIILLMNKKM